MQFPLNLALALNTPLHTPRLRLVPRIGADADLFHPHLQDAALYDWIAHTPPETPDAMRARWSAAERRVSPDGTEGWLAWAALSATDGSPLGWVDATLAAPDQCTNVGYLMVMRCWGQGIATEAVGAVIAHLEARGVASFHATVTVGNVASARVLEKLGFERAGVLVGNDTIRGVAVDDWVFRRRACD